MRSAFDARRKSEAMALVLEIAEALPPASAPLHPGLISGHAGLALFFSELAQVQEASTEAFDMHRRRATAHLEAALEGLESVEAHPSLFGGLAGVGWLASTMQRLGLVRFPTELFDDVDAQLTHMLESPWPSEVMFGVAGVGVYALERAQAGERALLHRVVSTLAANAVYQEGGARAYWNDNRAMAGASSEGVWLGVSHGVAGIAAFLARAFAAGHPDAGELSRSAMAWLLAQKRTEARGPLFWNRTGRAEAQFAWCHGDLGIACSMHVYEGALASANERTFFGRLRERVAFESVSVAKGEDMSLCHGRFGNAHLLHRLYRQGGAPAFADAAVAWWDAGIASRRHGSLTEAFPTSGANGVAACEPQDFLTGLVGIGLVALGVASDEAECWNAPLLVGG